MPQVKGHYGPWRECSEQEALETAEYYFRDFPDEQTNREIFEAHVKGIDYEQWRDYGRRMREAAQQACPRTDEAQAAL